MSYNVVAMRALASFWEGVFEAFTFFLLFTIIGMVLGAIGGFFGAAFAARDRGE